MKKVLLLLFCIAIISCKKEEPKTIAETKPLAEDIYKDFYGNWVGDFEITQADSTVLDRDYVMSNKLNLVLLKMEENGKAIGKSIVAGNVRPLEGNFTRSNAGFSFVMSEPGDKANDGQFRFVLSLSGKAISGEWNVGDKKFPVWQRKYNLTKQNFEYDPKLMLPDDGDYIDYYSAKVDSLKYENEDGSEEMSYSDVYRSASDVITTINASTTLLKENDLKNLKKLELEIIRNTIFARHGYTFKKKAFRQFFDPVDWYVPTTDDMSGKLTAIEQKNIVLLNRFQKYAEDNYDSFGR